MYFLIQESLGLEEGFEGVVTGLEGVFFGLEFFNRLNGQDK